MGIINLLNVAGSNFLGYIDPAATSVLLTSITAIVIAIGASAIIIWRKLKNKVSKTLHIDPNAKKEVEEDVVIDEELVKEDVKENNVTESSQESAEEVTSEESKPKTNKTAKQTSAKSTGAKKPSSAKSSTKTTKTASKSTKSTSKE